MARYGSYRNQQKKKRRRAGGRRWGGWFFLYGLLCLSLILLIAATRDKIAALTKKLADGITHVVTVTDEAEKEPLVSMENIRVVIMGDENGIYRSRIGIAGTAGCVVETAGNQSAAEPGQAYEFAAEANAADGSCIRVTPGEGGSLYLAGADGQALTPEYAGILEVWQEPEGYVLVNDVGLEEYLAGVLPSEMPENYGLEALKAQAVCARTYVYTRSMESGYPKYQAKVDDTVSYQVYNRQEATDLTREAVAQTAGQVLIAGDEPVDTLYFSTSCGLTQAGDLFGGEMNTDVLRSVYVGEGEAPDDLDSYLRSGDEQAFEKDSKYFRWQVRLEMDHRRREVVEKIASLKGEYAEDIEYSSALRNTIKKNKKKDVTEAFGAFRRMEIMERNDGGAVETLKMEFENGTVVVCGELRIRDILGAAVTSAVLGDGSDGGTVHRLYSSAFTWDVGADGAYVLYGGGYGHGVGMSQNGAKALCAAGYTYDQILNFFYQGCGLQVL